MPACKCRRGKCLVCGSSCKRCGCGCDGVPPHVALGRKNGQRGRARQYARPRKRNVAASTESQVAKKPCRDKPLETLNDVFAAFGFTPNQKANLPSRNDRQQGTVGDGQLKVLVRLLTDAAKAVAGILFPGDAQRLFTAMCIKEARSAEPTVPVASKDLENLSSAAAEILMAAPRRSIQRRVARAILTKGASRQLQRALVRQFDHKICLSAGRSEVKAYQDYETMVSGNVLQTVKRSLLRVPEQSIHSAVRFILAPSNTCALSWGTKAVRLSRCETITLPSLVRRMQLKDLYEQYIAADSSESHLGQSIFHEIAGTITQQNPALLSAVDYVTGTLVHDSLEVLQDIVDMCTSSSAEKEADESQIDPTQDPDADESQTQLTQDPDADESQIDPTQDPLTKASRHTGMPETSTVCGRTAMQANTTINGPTLTNNEGTSTPISILKGAQCLIQCNWSTLFTNGAQHFPVPRP